MPDIVRLPLKVVPAFETDFVRPPIGSGGPLAVLYQARRLDGVGQEAAGVGAFAAFELLGRVDDRQHAGVAAGADPPHAVRRAVVEAIAGRVTATTERRQCVSLIMETVSACCAANTWCNYFRRMSRFRLNTGDLWG